MRLFTSAKKIFYVAAFGFLGLLAQFLVHAVVEIPIIALLVKDFGRYGLGLSWDAWFAIHTVSSTILLGAGVLIGLWQGMYFSKRIYEK